VAVRGGAGGAAGLLVSNGAAASHLS